MCRENLNVTQLKDIQTDDSDDDEVMDEIFRDMEMIDNDIDISYDEANSDLEWINIL